MDLFDFLISFLAAVCPYNWGLIWNPNSVKVVQHKTSWSFKQTSDSKLLCRLKDYVFLCLRLSSNREVVQNEC